jgi:hypothetical protein
MMKKIALLISALFISAPLVFAQSNNTQQIDSENLEYHHALGVAAGYTTGCGLSYRYYNNRFFVQATFAPYLTEDRGFISAGVAFMYRVSDNEMANLFLYQANHYLYTKNSDYNYYYGTSDVNEHHQVNNGLGFGLEFAVEQVVLSIMTGFAAYDNFTQMGLTGEIGIYYKF